MSTVSVLKSSENVDFEVPNGLPFIFTVVTVWRLSTSLTDIVSPEGLPSINSGASWPSSADTSVSTIFDLGMRQVSLALPGLHSSIVSVMAGLPVSVFFSQVPIGESAAAAGDAPISDTSDANITITTVRERLIPSPPFSSLEASVRSPPLSRQPRGPRHRESNLPGPLRRQPWHDAESRMPNYHHFAPSRASMTLAACKTRESELVPAATSARMRAA